MRTHIHILALVLILLYGSITTYGATITSNATGNWNVGGTWIGGVVPGSADNVIISSGHTVTLVAPFTTSGSLTVSGTLQLAGFAITSGDLQGAGIITSSSGTPTLTTGSNNTSTSFSGVIGTGAIAFTQNGTGVLTISGSNTYTGLTTIAAGTLKLNNTGALGTTAGATSVTSGAVLDLNGINYSSAEVLTLAGTGISSGGCLINSNTTAATYAGNITLSTTAPTITANNPITLSGVISGGNASGTNSLTVAGNSTLTGALTISGNNTYTGLTTINSGALLKIGANNALGAGAPDGTWDPGDGNATIVNSGGVLDLNGITYTQYEGVRMNGAGFAAAGNGCIINSSSTAVIYSGAIDSWSSATLYISNPVTFNGVIICRNFNSITKTGSGTLTLTPSSGDRASNSFIIISAGTLKLGANLTETGSATVNTQILSGAVLDLNGFTCARYLYLNGTGISSGGALINNSSTPATHSGSVILESASSIVGNAGTIAITGTITGAGFGLTLGGTAGGSVTNVISGTSTTLTKNGSGTWNLSALNTYTGTTTVSAGILRATNNTLVASTNGAFGNNASGLFLNGGTIQSNVATFSRPITVSATNSGLDGYASARTISSAINNATGSTSYNLNVGGTTNGVLEGQNLTLSGVITNTPGTLSLTKIGTNTVTLSNATVTIQSLTINAGTVVSTSGILNLAGDFSNNGTFTSNSGNVTFNGPGIHTVTGSSTTPFNTITINKGTDYTSNILDVQSLITMTAGGLTLTNGTFKLTSASTITPFTADITTAPYRVPSTAGLWCNGGTISPSANNWSMDGLLRVTSGTVTVGNAANHILGPKPNSSIIVEGGNLYVTGRISNPTNPWTFNMTGGTMTINTMGTTTAGRPPFYMDVAGSSFSMSGGTMIIERAGGTAGQNLGFHSVATSGTGFTGGVLQIGNGSTPAASTIGITSTNPIYNLTVNSTNATAQLQTSALSVTNTVTISAGTLDPNSLDLTVGGNWINNGTFTSGTATVTFNGTTIISGTTTTNTFNNLTVAAASTVTSSTGITGLVVNGTLNTGASALLDLGTTTVLSGTLGTISNTGTIKTFVITTTSATPVPIGKTWGGTIEYGTVNGGQTVVGGTYNNLASGAAGPAGTYKINTASGNLVVNGTITTIAWGIIDMGATYIFSGTLTTINNDGNIRTAVPTSLSTTPIPSGKTWGGTIDYSATAGSQTIVAGTFNIISLLNTSGINSAGGNLTVSQLMTSAGGTLDMGSSYRIINGGNIFNDGTIKTSVPTATSALPLPAGKTWGGTIEYTALTGAQTVMNGTYNNLKLSNTSGTNSVSGNITVGGTMTFTAGTITTGANNIYLNATGTVSRTSGHVIGNFKKYIATGATSKTFEIGDATNYTPVTVAFASVTTAGDLTASVTATDHPNLAGSGIRTDKTVNRYWTLTNSGIVFTTATNTLNWVAGDLDAGTTTANFKAGNYNSPTWTLPAVASPLAASIQATGLTSFGDYAVGEYCAVISQIPLTNLIANYKFTGNASDATGNNNGTLQNSPMLAADRFGITNSAYTFDGSSQYVSTANIYVNPTNFTISIWFKTATASGGQLMGFGNAQTGQSGTHDRKIYMNNAGNIYFGVYTGSTLTVNSPLSYNDNNWHLATATLSSTAGMVLYMDGLQVAADANTTAQNITGYWRIGYDNLGGWPSTHSSYYFNGALDDALVYHTALNSTQVATLYNSPDGADGNTPVCAGTSLNLTATTVGGATYSWTGPNGFTSSSQNPTFSYSAPYAGVYTVQATAGGCTSTAYKNITTATSSTISYTGSPYCTAGGTASVTFSGTAGGTYTSTAGLTINAATGVVTLGTSTAGTYTVTYTVPGGCTATTAITITTSPTTSNAGADQTGATTCGLTTVTLAANAPSVGTGAWGIVSGSGGTVTTPSSATSTFSGTAGTTYTLRWTISNGTCTSTDDVVITFNQNPTTANAGADQTGAATCGLTTVTLAANAPAIGTGAWSIVSGAGGTVTTPTSATSTFSGTAGTTYTLTWTISNSPCTASTDDVVITFNRNPTTSAAGTDQTGAATCGLTTVTLAANAPSIGTGAWSIVSGAGGSFGNTASATSTFSGTAGTSYTLRWTISNSPCTVSTDDVVITFNQNPTTSAAGADQTGAATCGLTTVTLAANAPSIGTGAWSIVSGAGGTVTTPTSAISTFSGTAGTTYTLRWTISNSPCTASTDDVVITFSPSPSATISYTGAPYYVSGGTASVTFSGTTGGTYSSTAGLSINVATGGITLGTSTPATYTVTYTIAAAGSCSVYTTTASITVLYNLKTWDGGAGTNNWGDAANWNADGVPTSTDDVDLTGANTININVAGVANNLTLNNAGLILTVNAGNSLAVSGNLTLTTGVLNTANAFPTVTGTVNVAGGTVGFTGSSAQTIPAYNYNNLTSSSTGSRILAGSGTIGIAGTFTPGTNTYTITGSTVNYNAAGVQTIAAFNYNNLTLSNSGAKTFSSGTTGIASALSITGSATANATTNSSVISYNGSANQTITALTYYGLNVSSTGGTVTGINTTVTNFSMNSGTVDLNTLTLTVTGTGTFTSGTINNGTVTSTGGTTTFAGTVFGAIVNATSNNLYLNGSTFNNTANLTKNGGTNAVSTGGNIYNGVTTLVNSGSGSLDLGSTLPETFNANLTINNTGASRVQIGISSVGNQFNGNTTINHGGNTTSLNTIIARNPGSTATFNGNLTLNSTNLNAASGIVISNEGSVTINGNVIVSSTNGRGILFSDVAGSVTLAAGYTISDAGAGSFTTGTLKLSRFIQTGATAQNTALTGTALLQIGPSSTFNGNVTFVSPQVLLHGCTYNSTASFTKNGAGNNLGNGGNTFNGATTLVNSNNSAAYFATGFTTADIFNADLTITNTGTGFMALADEKAGTMFNGNIIVNSTNGAANAGVAFGNGPGTAVTSTLAAGKTISVGGTGFTAGRLQLRRMIQSGATAQGFTLAGTSMLYLGSGSTFNGSVNFVSPQLVLSGCVFNGTTLLTKNGATDNQSNANNIFNAAATITSSGTGYMRLAGADDFNSDATFIQTGSGLLQPAYANTTTFAGNVSTAGTATAIGFGTGTGTVTLNGTIAQIIDGSLPPTFYNLIISNTGNTVTSGVNSSVTGNLSVTSGTFDLGSFTANRLTAGGTLTVSNGAKLKIGGTNTVPSNYSTHSIGATSTIEYSGTNQSVAVLNSSQNYGHLAVSGSGTALNSADVTVRNNVTITAGSLNINTYTLKIGGSISNSGTFTASNGTIEMNGTTAQTIPATAFAGKTIKNLTINNTSNVTLADTLKLTSDLTVSNGSLITGGFLVLKSSATATARVAQITSGAGTPISGNVIVERYVPGRRKYRLITSPVTTHANATLTSGQEGYSIWGNWQNQGNNTTPTIGNLITGGSGADGFDPQTSNASLFTYDDVNRSYVGYTTANGKNTKYTPLKAGVAYFMFVYGDRLNSVFATSPHNTVLISTGTLLTGNQVYNTGSTIPLTAVTARFTLLGNPFASPVDWATIPKTDLENTYWGWDPNLSSTGGYITVSTTGTVTLQAPYSGSTGLNQYIQPGQGFFVKTSGPSPVLTIREQDKVSNFNSNAFRTSRIANDIPLLAINLQYVSSGNKILADGVLTAFDVTFSNQSGAEDATKMANSAESIAILNDTTSLSIDARQLPQNNDTLFLNVSRLTKPQYTLQIFAKQMEGRGLQAYLQDRFLNTLQLLSLSDTNHIVIDVNAGTPASSDINRFRVVFQSSIIPLPVTYTSIKGTLKNTGIQIDWEVVEESGILKYEIEKSVDAIHFHKVAEVTARGNNSAESYYWLDVNPVTGNNYYYVRAIQADGKYFISKTVVIKITTDKPGIKIFPNPVKNQQINIRADKMEKGRYTLRLHNQQGQQVMHRVIDHPGGSLNQIIYVSKMWRAGMYYLQLATEQEKYGQTIFLE